MSEKETPKPSNSPAPTRERIERGYQPGGRGPQGGHQPTTGEGAPITPPSRGSGGKK
jgi:hypothetical protein